MIKGRLQPINKRMKCLIKEHGAEWEILSIGRQGVQIRSISNGNKVSNVEMEEILIPS